MISSTERQFIRSNVKQNLRVDGRELMQSRQLEIETSKFEQNSGSSVINWGPTKVIVGVDLAITESNVLDDDDDEGTKTLDKITLQIESMSTISITQDYKLFLETMLNSCLDLKTFQIVPGVSWQLIIKITVIYNGGNLLDAICLGLRTALYKTLIPKTSCCEIDGNYEYELLDEYEYLKVREMVPISTSIVLIQGKMLLDCTMEEEECCDGKLGVLCDYNGNVVGLLKECDGVEPEILVEMVRVGKEKCLETFKNLKRVEQGL